MARLTIEDCRPHVPNQFELVLLAALRARELNAGAEPVIERDARKKSTVVALREIAAGRLEPGRLREALVSRRLMRQEAPPGDDERFEETNVAGEVPGGADRECGLAPRPSAGDRGTLGIGDALSNAA